MKISKKAWRLYELISLLNTLHWQLSMILIKKIQKSPKLKPLKTKGKLPLVHGVDTKI